MLKSTLLSRAHEPRKTFSFPIVASWPTRFRKARSAKLELGGQLFVGYWPRSEKAEAGIAPGASQPSAFILERGSECVTGGWVVLGRGVQTRVGPGASLYIGAGIYVTGNSEIVCTKEIHIGADCAISCRVLIIDSGSHFFS